MAAAVPRSLVGNHAATIWLLPGKAGLSDKPTRKRNKNRTLMTAPVLPKISEKPIKIVKNDHKKILAK